MCILLVLLLAFAGCTRNVESTATSKPTTAATAKATPTPQETLEPYEVVWYLFDTGSQPDEKLIENAMADYLKDKINTTVNIVMPTDYDTTVRTAISSGEKIDLMFSCSWLTNYVEIAREGWAVELTDEMLATYAPHALEVLSGPFIDGNKVDGKLYHLACNKEIGTTAGALLNKALVDKYNMDISTIDSYDDLGPFFKIIKDNEPDVYPVEEGTDQMINCLGNLGAFDWMKQVRGSDQWVVEFDIPEVVDMYVTAKEYYDAGYVREDAITGGIDVTSDMKAGKLFAAFVQLKPGKDAEMTKSTGVEWVQVALVDPVVRSADVGGSMMCIPITSKDPNRVLMFYDYFYYDREILTLMNRGIENVHYVRIDDNTLDFAPDTNNGTDSGWLPSFSIWEVGNQFKNYIFKGEDPEKYTKLAEFNSQCTPFESVGFLFDTTNCQNMIDKLRAAGSDIRKLLTYGMVDDVQAAMAEQLKAWNDAGLQDVLTEYNRQYQEWLASK
jgi:putative aldouronate transport system substrate-binding protein